LPESHLAKGTSDNLNVFSSSALIAGVALDADKEKVKSNLNFGKSINRYVLKGYLPGRLALTQNFLYDRLKTMKICDGFFCSTNLLSSGRGLNVMDGKLQYTVKQAKEPKFWDVLLRKEGSFSVTLSPRAASNRTIHISSRLLGRLMRVWNKKHALQWKPYKSVQITSI